MQMESYPAQSSETSSFRSAQYLETHPRVSVAA